jgi:hypothetical protein
LNILIVEQEFDEIDRNIEAQVFIEEENMEAQELADPLLYNKNSNIELLPERRNFY